MNLLHDPWIPIRRESGAVERIAPWQLTDDLAGDRVVSLASPRADFDGSLAQLLVGILQATMAPKNQRAWIRGLEGAPTPEELHDAFEPIAHAFELVGREGDGPRFLQDLTLEEEEAKTQGVEKLLIDASLHSGRDHFRKGGQVEWLCLPCAASALTTLQLSAPVGGRGHRASPRGGGPVTTLVRTGDRPASEGDDHYGLWWTLWANVLSAETFPGLEDTEHDEPGDRFPWLAPPRLSDPKGRDTTAADVHPLQLFWPTPRRLRLLVEEAAGETPARCDLCDEVAERGVREYWTRHHGVNYTGVWDHPFTPLRKAKDGTLFPLHTDSTGLAYRHWLGLVQSDPERNIAPAPVVRRLWDLRGIPADLSGWRLWAFGYDMDNMKARCWYEGMMRLELPDDGDPEHFQELTAALIRAARHVEWALLAAAKQVVARREQDVKRDLTAVEARFWQATEGEFYRFLQELVGVSARADQEEEIAFKRRWHKVLLRYANTIFEDWSASGMFQAVDPAQVARAWNRLQGNLWGPNLRKKLGVADLKTSTDTTDANTEEAA